MVDIQHPGIIDRMDRDTRAQPSMALPRKLKDDIQPVLEVNPQPELLTIRDDLVNDSDKTFTVPVGKRWKILYGFVLMVTTATAGNRTMEFRCSDANGNIIYFAQALNAITASTTESLTFGQFGDVSEAVAIRHLIPIPVNLTLDEDYSFRIRDSAGIAPAADDMTVGFVIEQTDSKGA